MQNYTVYKRCVVGLLALMCCVPFALGDDDAQSSHFALQALSYFAIDDDICSLAYSSDGRTIATGSPSKICLWTAATGKLICEEEINPNDTEICRYISFSPDGKKLASVHEGSRADRPRILYQLRNIGVGGKLGPPKLLFARNNDGWSGYESVRHVSFSLDSKTVAAGDSHGDIHIWKTDTGKETVGFSGGVAASYSADGKTVYGISPDGQITGFDASNGQASKEIKNGRRTDFLRVTQLAFAPKKGILAISDGSSICLKEAATDKVLWRAMIKRGLVSMEFSVDGKILAVSTYKDGNWFFDCETGQVSNYFNTKEPTYGYLAFSPDGKTLSLSEKKLVKTYGAKFVAGQKDVMPELVNTDPPNVSLEARLECEQEEYKLDLQGKTVEELSKLILFGETVPAPKVKMAYKLKNTGERELRIQFSDPIIMRLFGEGGLNTSGEHPTKTGEAMPAKAIRLDPGKTHTFRITNLGDAYWLVPGQYTLFTICLMKISPGPKEAELNDKGFADVTIWSIPVKVRVTKGK